MKQYKIYLIPGCACNGRPVAGDDWKQSKQSQNVIPGCAVCVVRRQYNTICVECVFK